MTIGEKLLKLTVEYQESVKIREWDGAFAGKPAGREPQAIAADYESTLRELLA